MQVALERWTNCIVLALTHLALGCPRVCPAAGCSGRDLNSLQQQVCLEIQSLVKPMLRADFGMTSRGEKLEQMARYVNTMSSTSLGLCVPQEQSKQSVFSSDRIRFMKQKSNFDVTPWLDVFEAACLVEPRLLERSEPLSHPPVAPQGGTTTELIKYVSQWDASGRLLLVDSRLKHMLRFSKMFPVPKTAEEDRGVMDRRIPNCHE